MPIPKPKAGENEDDYIGRCVSALTDDGEFKDQKQRLAVCFSTWRDSKSESGEFSIHSELRNYVEDKLSNEEG